MVLPLVDRSDKSEPILTQLSLAWKWFCKSMQSSP